MTNASSHPHPLSYSLPLDSAGDIESSREVINIYHFCSHNCCLTKTRAWL